MTNDSVSASVPVGESPIKRGRFREYRGFFILFVGGFFVYVISPFLKPLAMGAIFAVVLYPLFARWRRPPLGASARALALTTAFTLLFLIPLGLMLYRGADAALRQIQNLQESSSTGAPWSAASIFDLLGLRPIIDQLTHLLPVEPHQMNALLDQTGTAVRNQILGFLQGFLASLPEAVFALSIVLVTIYYLLVDGPKLLLFLRRNSFFSGEATETMFTVTRDLCQSVVVATIMAGAVQTACLALAALIAGTANIFVLILVTFILSFVPVIGTAPVTVGLALHYLAGGHYREAATFVILGLIAGLSDNFVRPYFIGGGAKLHPLIAFVSAFGALQVMGFSGLFLGPIVAGVFLHMLPVFLKSLSNQRS